jgi:large subunit ribosomal protein L25
VADYTLEAQPRTVIGKQVGQLRSQGIIPIVVYGPRTEPINLQVPYRLLELTLAKAGGTNLIDIQYDGKTQTVLAREVQRDFLRGNILHVDFFAVDESATIRADIYIHLVGTSPAVAAGMGILLNGTSTITIETLPSKLINQVEVDLAKLEKVGDAIHVSDLDLGPDIAIINDPEDMIVRVTQTSAARSEEEEAAAAEGAPSEPEVIARGKAEEEDF